MNKLRIIFLDIDGTVKKVGQKGFDTQSIDNLNELIKQTGAQIVISSNWRINGLDYVIEKIGQYLIGEIIDITPVLEIATTKFDADGPRVPRGTEIKEWIRKHTTSSQYVSSYVIIDDSTDILYSQINRYVHVNQTKGFDSRCLLEAIKILSMINI